MILVPSVLANATFNCVDPPFKIVEGPVTVKVEVAAGITVIKPEVPL